MNDKLANKDVIATVFHTAITTAHLVAQNNFVFGRGPCNIKELILEGKVPNAILPFNHIAICAMMD